MPVSIVAEGPRVTSLPQLQWRFGGRESDAKFTPLTSYLSDINPLEILMAPSNLCACVCVLCAKKRFGRAAGGIVVVYLDTKG